MNFKDLMKWNTRVSAIYAVGIWTMLGSYAYLRHTGRYDDPEASKEIKEVEEPNKQIYKSAHSETVIIYKENFVPYSTRIYSFIKSLTGEPGPGDSNK